MDWDRKSIRVGAWVIACAVVLRLLSGGGLNAAINALTSPQAVSWMLFLETGRLVRPGPTEAATQPTKSTDPIAGTQPTQIPETTAPVQTPPLEALAVFSPDDAALVQVNSVCGYSADVQAYLQETLAWDLTADAPTVLILHSHATESYTPNGQYQESSAYRTTDAGYNMVSVGDRLVQILEAGGVKAVHDRHLHDYPSYSDSYGNARESIRQYLEQYPTIRLVLDIHRDSVTDGSGSQMQFCAQADGQQAAQLMLVVGSDASGLSHPHWPENMSLAVKLHAQLEKNTPGICRPISFRSQRFNQDLSPGALIVEVGAAGNAHGEALLAVELLGQAILDLSRGAAAQ